MCQLDALLSQILLLLRGLGLQKLFCDIVEFLDATGVRCQATASNPVGASLLVNELDNTVFVAFTVVVCDVSFSIKELDGRVSLNFVLFSSLDLLGGIDLRNYDL